MYDRLQSNNRLAVWDPVLRPVVLQEHQPRLAHMADLKPATVMTTMTRVLPRTFSRRLSAYTTYTSQSGIRLSLVHNKPTTHRHQTYPGRPSHWVLATDRKVGHFFTRVKVSPMD